MSAHFDFTGRVDTREMPVRPRTDERRSGLIEHQYRGMHLHAGKRHVPFSGRVDLIVDARGNERTFGLLSGISPPTGERLPIGVEDECCPTRAGRVLPRRVDLVRIVFVDISMKGKAVAITSEDDLPLLV